MSVWNHRSVTTVWALQNTNIAKALSIARVLRHFVLVPHEITVRKSLLHIYHQIYNSSSDLRENFSLQRDISIATLTVPSPSSLRDATSPLGEARSLAENHDKQLIYRVRNSNFSKWVPGSTGTRGRNLLLQSDKFYRSSVLLPHEICVKKLLLTETIFNCDAQPPSASLRSAPSLY